MKFTKLSLAVLGLSCFISYANALDTTPLPAPLIEFPVSGWGNTWQCISSFTGVD